MFNALKEGNAALNKLHDEMPLDKVEELMADTAESIAMEEVSHSSSSSSSTGWHFLGFFPSFLLSIWSFRCSVAVGGEGV